MKYIVLILFVILASIDISYGQCVNNPQLQNEALAPAPLINDAGGMFSFDYSESLLDYSDLNDPVQILISLQNIAPVGGASAVSGPYASNFTWQYDSAVNVLLGVQNATLPGGAGGNIQVVFEQTNPIDCPDDQMGFIANVIPASCMVGQNDTSDDSASAYTCRMEVVLPPTCEASAPVISGN